MNLLYDQYPTSIVVCGEEIPIITDFREYIRLMDMLNDDELLAAEKAELLSQYFLLLPGDFAEAMEALTDFILVRTEEEENENQKESEKKRELYSFQYDYLFIFSAFFSEYGINIQTIPYMHWWEFRTLFEGLSESTEIKQRMMYRSIDLSTIKDKEERKRIQKIQEAIRLPDSKLNDYDIGSAFEW